MKQLIKNITIQIYKVLTYLIPVNKKMIIFQSSNGRNYTGNPRYIYEEMVREGLDQEYECIWFFFVFSDLSRRIIIDQNIIPWISDL